VRHDDPHLGPYTPHEAVIRSAIELASDVDGLRLVLASTLGDRYLVRVSDDGCTVGLWRLRQIAYDGPGRPLRLRAVPGHPLRSLASPWLAALLASFAG
jgi:hypothetical protein